MNLASIKSWRLCRRRPVQANQCVWSPGQIHLAASWLLIGLLAAVVPVHAAAWSQVVLYPDRDNTLYETEMDAPGSANEVSNGAGSYLFAGRTNIDSGFRLRRGLLRFDLSAIPQGSKIVSAELTVYQSKVPPNPFPVTTYLHRLLEDWGEGAADGIGPEGQGAPAQPGDATWFQSFYNSSNWTDPGGTFETSASASTTLGPVLGDYTWSCSSALVTDLQSWLDNDAGNFGWIIIGSESGGGNARRFNSRNHADEETRPRLRVIFRTIGAVFSHGFEAVNPCSP